MIRRLNFVNQHLAVIAGQILTVPAIVKLRLATTEGRGIIICARNLKLPLQKNNTNPAYHGQWGYEQSFLGVTFTVRPVTP